MEKRNKARLKLIKKKAIKRQFNDLLFLKPIS